MDKNKKFQNFSRLSFFIAIMTIMWLVPFLGYIPLGFTRATIIHIPVIIGSIMLGPKSGIVLGLFFGLTSFITNTIQPTITSFVFTPFYSIADFDGGFLSLVVCFVPRILVGIVPWFSYHFLLRFFKKSKNSFMPFFISGIVGSITNTLLVVSFIWMFFGKDYAIANNIILESLGGFLLSLIAINGIPEMIVAGFLTANLGVVLINKFNKYSNQRRQINDFSN